MPRLVEGIDMDPDWDYPDPDWDDPDPILQKEPHLGPDPGKRLRIRTVFGWVGIQIWPFRKQDPDPCFDKKKLTRIQPSYVPFPPFQHPF